MNNYGLIILIALGFSSQQLLFLPLYSQGPKLSIQTGHNNAVSKLSFHSNPSLLISLSEDQSVITWDPIAGKQLSKYFSENGFRSKPLISPKTGLLAILNNNGALSIIDRTTGRLSYKLSDSSLAFHFVNENIIMYVTNKEVQLANLLDGTREKVFHLNEIATAAVFSNDGKYLTLKISSPLRLLTIDLNNLNNRIAQPIRPKATIHQFQYYPLQDYLVTLTQIGGRPAVVSVRKLFAANKPVFQRISEFSNISYFSFDLIADGRYLAIGSGDFSVEIWDIANNKLHQKLSDHAGEVSALQFSPDGRFLASGSFDRSICLYDVEKDFQLGHRLTGRVSRKTCIASNSQFSVVVGTELGDIYMHESSYTSTPLELIHIRPHTSKVSEINLPDFTALGNDSSVIMSSSYDGSVALTDVKSRKNIYKLEGYKREEIGLRNDYFWLVYNPLTFIMPGNAIRWGMSKYHASQISTFDYYNNRLYIGGRIGLSHKRVPIKIFALKERGPKLLGTVKINREQINGLRILPNQNIMLSWGGKIMPNSFTLKTKPHKKRWVKNTSKVWATDIRRRKSIGILDVSNHLNRIQDLDISNSWLILGGIGIDNSFETRTMSEADIALKLEKIHQENFPSDIVLVFERSTESFNIRDARFKFKVKGSGPFAIRNDTLYYIQETNIVAMDLTNSQELFRLSGHSDRISDIQLDSSRNVLLSGSWDGTLKIWDLEKIELLQTMIHTNDGGFMLINPDNYYMSTRTAFDAIGYHKNNRFFSFENFDLKFNRPDLVLDRSKQYSPSLIESYHNAYKKRLQRYGFTEEMLSDDFRVPECRIKNEIAPRTRDPKIEIEVEAFDSLRLLDRLNVFVNDVPIYGIQGINLRNENIQEYTITLNIPLSQGENKIQVSALNQGGVESIKATTYITYDSPEVQPDLYLITIGVSDYRAEGKDLKYAAKDAQDISEFYSTSTSFDQIHTRTLTNQQVTKANILALRTFLEQSQIDDQILIYVSGHGLLDEGYDFYYATQDIDFAHPVERGILYDDIEGLLDGILARKKLLLMDACHSGEYDENSVPITQAQQKNLKAKGVAYKGFNKGSDEDMPVLGLQNSFEMMQQLFADLRRGSGATVISSSSGMQFSYEDPEWQNGAFTYVFLRGLKTMKADADKDGEVTASEIQNYVSEWVPRLTEGLQVPTFRQENLEYDFRVW